MDLKRDESGQNPLVLLGVFVAISAILFALFKFTGADADDVTQMTTAELGGQPGQPGGSGGTEPGAVESSEAPAGKAGRKVPQAGRPSVPVPGGNLEPQRLERWLKENEAAAPTPTGGQSGTGLSLGALPGFVNEAVGQPVSGEVGVAVANIPGGRTSAAGLSSSMGSLTSSADFVILNEVSAYSTDTLEGAAPGFEAYRDPVPDRSAGGAGQSMNNVLMWRSDTWQLLDAGRVKVVDQDLGYHHGRPFNWDRYATWGVFHRPSDGAIVSLVSTHMPTNPGKYPKTRGMSRVANYGRGMDINVQLVNLLSKFGPVFFGGDMNSHASQGSWTAAGKMTSQGWQYTKDRGVMYLFHQPGVQLLQSTQVGIASDHPGLVTRFDMSGQGPA